MRTFLMVLTTLYLCFANAAQNPADDSILRPEIKLTDQSGQDFSLANRAGKVQIVSMFYTSCKFVCPLIIDSALGVVHELSEQERGRLQILLISMDPARDTPEKLSVVANKRHLNLAMFTLARPQIRDVRKIAALLGIRFRELAGGDFNHTSALILLDAQGRVLKHTERLGTIVDPAFLVAVKAALASPK
jgi:protein SCO1